MTPAQALAHSQAQGDSGSAWEAVLRRVCAGAAGAYDSRACLPRDRLAPLVIRQKPPQDSNEAAVAAIESGASAADASGSSTAVAGGGGGGGLFELLKFRSLHNGSGSGSIGSSGGAGDVVSDWSLFAAFISQSLRQVEGLIAGLFGRPSLSPGDSVDEHEFDIEKEPLDILTALGRIDAAALTRLCSLTAGEVNVILQVCVCVCVCECERVHVSVDPCWR